MFRSILKFSFFSSKSDGFYFHIDILSSLHYAVCFNYSARFVNLCFSECRPFNYNIFRVTDLPQSNNTLTIIIIMKIMVLKFETPIIFDRLRLVFGFCAK